MRWLLFWLAITVLVLLLAMKGVTTVVLFALIAYTLLQVCMHVVTADEEKTTYRSVSADLRAHMKTWDKIQELQETEANILSSLGGLVSYNEVNAEIATELRNTITAIKRQNTMINERIVALAREYEEGKHHE